MKYIKTMALMLTLGAAGVYAHQAQVKMTFSGSFVRTSIDLQPDTVTDEENFAGNGTLGPFTFLNLRTDTTSPETSSTCTTGPYFRIVAGGGVFRSKGGSLLTVQSRGGIRLRRSRGSGGPLYCDVSDHRWNRPFQGCVRHPYVDIHRGPGGSRRL
jgi:hypothetical protein